MFYPGQAPPAAPPRLPELTPPSPPRHTAPRVRRLLAAVMCAACAIAGLAAGRLLPRTPAARPAAPATPAPQASPAARPPAATSPARPGRPGAYRLLPVTTRQLTAATDAAAAFTRLYGTYSYTQAASAYLARLQPYTAPGLQAALADAATAPGLLQLRARQHASATCTATATAIRDIAGTTITVLVTARQDTRIQATAHTAVSDYAITLALAGAGWQVYDIEPATAGQAGGTS